MPVINVVGRTVVPVLVVLAAPATVRSGNFEDGREPQGFQEPMSAASLPPIGSRVSISGLNDTDDAPCGGHLGGVSRSRPMESKSQAKLQAIEPTVNWPLTDLNKFPGKVVGVIYETGKAHAMPEFGMPAGGTACVYMMRVQPVGMTAPGLVLLAVLVDSKSNEVLMYKDVLFTVHPERPGKKAGVCWSADPSLLPDPVGPDDPNPCPDRSIVVPSEGELAKKGIKGDSVLVLQAQAWNKIMENGGPWFTCAKNGCCRL